MICLSLDASTKRASVAIQEILSGSKIKPLAYVKSENPRTHSEFLNTGIQDAMAQAGLNFDKLGQIAVGIGPGSFTGIRVALNIAKSICYLKSIPIVGVTTFEALLSQTTSVPALCLFNAFKGQAYSALGTSTQVQFQDLSLPFSEIEGRIADLDQVVGLGDMFLDFQNLLPESIKKRVRRDSNLMDYPDATLVAKVAANKASTIDWNLIQPLYIRESEAEENLKSK